MKSIAIVGSTGSIGTQTLDVARELGNMRVVSLTCNSNIALLKQQIREFRPKYAAVSDQEKAKLLRRSVDNGTIILSGEEGIVEACTAREVDTVVNATVGISGLVPTMESLRAGKELALANKESLVVGGDMVMGMARKHGKRILPIDSEHSAIFQCMEGNQDNRVEKIIITASGGPFRGRTRAQLRDVTPEQALNHPTWKMGRKITIDSATLMNKGFEVIEAVHLFGLDVEQVEVVVHPQSVVHSAVQYPDSSIMAQLGNPDMRLPIQYALNYPKRPKNRIRRFDFFGRELTFMEPDLETFKCLRLAFEAMKKGGTTTAALNGANEMAVALFLDRKISFLDIPDSLERVVKEHRPKRQDMESVFEADAWARKMVLRLNGQ